MGKRTFVVAGEIKLDSTKFPEGIPESLMGAIESTLQGDLSQVGRVIRSGSNPFNGSRVVRVESYKVVFAQRGSQVIIQSIV